MSSAINWPERVKASALLLDKEVKDWHKDIDTSILDTCSGSCVCNQLNHKRQYKGNIYDVDRAFAIGTYDFDYKDLTNLWRKEIESRLNATGLSFAEAMYAAAAGKKVRVTTWGSDIYWVLPPDSRCVSNIDQRDALASWELFDDRPTADTVPVGEQFEVKVDGYTHTLTRIHDNNIEKTAGMIAAYDEKNYTVLRVASNSKVTIKI